MIKLKNFKPKKKVVNKRKKKNKKIGVPTQKFALG